MQYYSLNKRAPRVSFKEALINGIAPDKGLYFPERIPTLPKPFFENFESYSNQEIALEAILPFVGDVVDKNSLAEILSEVLDFDFPLVEIEEGVASLELFHGPTMAFKDVGARFMAKCLGYFSKKSEAKVTVLVATSGDTGGAVANGFLDVEGVNVVILYPSGKVSDIQERQLTTLGKNITALEVKGSFDDCQRMVKNAFVDQDLINTMQLTSANSINVARWLPQMFYFMFAYKQLAQKGKQLVFSVPSGNFGNLCAGMLSQKMGLPIAHFVAATNSNDTIPKFMKSGRYAPQTSVATISNAMDVGDPSNFIRIQELYGNRFDSLKKWLSSYTFTDHATRDAIKAIYKKSGYVADPHGAVGYLGLQAFLKEKTDHYGVFLETAHPVKFLDTVEACLGKSISLPQQIEKLMHREKRSVEIETYQDFKAFLINQNP